MVVVPTEVHQVETHQVDTPTVSQPVEVKPEVDAAAGRSTEVIAMVSKIRTILGLTNLQQPTSEQD